MSPTFFLHSLNSRLGVGKSGEGTQLRPLASTEQRDFPYHMLSAQIKKLSKARCKWGAFVICNVCLLEQLLHVWKCSFPGSGQTSLADGNVENNIFSSYFVPTTFHFWFSKLPYHDVCIVVPFISSPLSSCKGVWWSSLLGSWCPDKVNPPQWVTGLLKLKHILLAYLGDTINTNTVCSPVLT